jgi:phage shock protein PspC (stress-responsive transcriptional regulator)
LAFLLGFFTLSTGLALVVFYVIAALVVPYGESGEAEHPSAHQP